MQNFIGNQQAVQLLHRHVRQGAVGHAYLLVGPSGVGKTTLAQLFAKLLLCQAPGHQADLKDCGVCRSCLAAGNKAHPDWQVVERSLDERTGQPVKNITIDQVRQLQQRLAVKPLLGVYQVACIVDAQAMTLEAANALLKTLEEPAPAVVLVLTASDQGALPPTLVSRCQLLRLRTVRQTEISAWLHAQGIAKADVQKISRLGLGRPGRAWRLASNLDEVTFLREAAADFLQLCRLPLADRLLRAQAIVEQADTFFDWLSAANVLLRDGLLLAAGQSGFTSGLVSPEQFAALSSRPANWFSRLLSELAETERLLARNVNPRLALENFVLAF